MAGVAFGMPIHPGPNPIHFAAATTAQITETNRQYTNSLSEFNLVSTLNTALTALLITAVDDVYIAKLSDATMAYANVTVRALLQHLQTTYVAITFTQLDQNLAKLDRDFNPDEPMELLWKRVKETRQFAADSQDPISEITAVRKTLSVLKKTGVFTDAIKDWRKRADADWTWANFKSDFNLANNERERALTAATAGYHSANAVQAEAQQATTLLE
jgi:hypothetical protein